VSEPDGIPADRLVFVRTKDIGELDSRSSFHRISGAR